MRRSRQTIVGCELDRTVLGKLNPRTKVPARPPIAIQVLCDAEDADEAFALIAAINASRGWRGETYEHPLYWEKE